MNKRMREIMSQIEGVQARAKAAFDAKDLDGARALADEADALKGEFELAERLFDGEKALAEPVAEKAAERAAARDEEQVVKEFGRAAKLGFKAMSEGVAADGGYAVPEDVSTRIEQLRTAKSSLLDLVGYESVTTNKGSRTFQKRSDVAGFSLIPEGGAIAAAAEPKFDRYSFDIKKYGGFFALTNELLADSDANVGETLISWIADQSRATANRLILAVMDAAPAVECTGLDDIKRAVNVTLGQAFAPTAAIVTNDDGLNWLDTLKDLDGDPLLKSSANDPLDQVLAVGFRMVPIRVVPNSDLKSGVDGIPLYVGDLREGVTYFDRRSRSVMASTTAAVGEVNAFGNDLTLYRAIEREDVVKRDGAAWVRLAVKAGE